MAVAQSAGTKPAAPDPKPCSVIPDPDPCGTTPKPAGSQSAPSAADRFPFPGEPSANSAPGIGAPSAPNAPASASQPADTATRFPFPGEGSGSATAPDMPATPSPADASSSSSSSSSSSGDNPNPFGDAASPDLKDAGSEGTQTRPSGHILHRAPPPAPKPQTAAEREEEDLRVANFNLDSGNVPGAYMRARDAVKTAPDDPEAHFALAETAAKLGKKEEAIAEYKACLSLDPSDDRRKASDKALQRLSK